MFCDLTVGITKLVSPYKDQVRLILANNVKLVCSIYVVASEPVCHATFVKSGVLLYAKSLKQQELIKAGWTVESDEKVMGYQVSAHQMAEFLTSNLSHLSESKMTEIRRAFRSIGFSYVNAERLMSDANFGAW